MNPIEDYLGEKIKNLLNLTEVPSTAPRLVMKLQIPKVAEKL